MEKKAIPNSLAPRKRKLGKPTPDAKTAKVVAKKESVKKKPKAPVAKATPAVKPEAEAPVVETVVKSKQTAAPKPVATTKAAAKSTPDIPKDERRRFNFLMGKKLYKKMKLHCMDEEITGANYIESLIMKDLGL